MASSDIVCIAEDTYNPEVNEIGDVVDVVEAGNFTGNGAKGFQLIRVEGIDPDVLKEILWARVPEVKAAFSLPVNAGEWTFERPKEKMVWKDGDDWKDLVVDPKFKISVATLTKEDLDALANPEIEPADKTIILQKCQDKISAIADNTKTVVSIASV